jgi:hypothetical protein
MDMDIDMDLDLDLDVEDRMEHENVSSLPTAKAKLTV